MNDNSRAKSVGRVSLQSILRKEVTIRTYSTQPYVTFKLLYLTIARRNTLSGLWKPLRPSISPSQGNTAKAVNRPTLYETKLLLAQDI